ncbi:MAG TPA: glycosyltransferase family 2 protein [Acidimicrobiia bacterium]|nr:glycosyltransferase family 2 protein [Acidimicrobiia bacterium]
MATDSLDLSVIVVSYNTRELLEGCLRSVFSETTSVRLEVVVVDNASSDGSADMVATEFAEVALIRSDNNDGFARACNRGVAASHAPWIVLLNPDTEVHDRALERLLDFGRAHPRAGLTGGRTLRPDGTVDPGSCWGDITLWSLTCFAFGLSTALRHSEAFDPESLGRWERDSVRAVDIITGCLLAASRETWDRLGGFDERFFMYAEDADLAMRARAAGFRPAITPDATITHVLAAASGSGARSRAMVLRGKTTLLAKHWSPARARAGVALLVIGAGLRSLGARLVGRTSSPWPDVWNARATWRRGWPPVPDTPQRS